MDTRNDMTRLSVMIIGCVILGMVWPAEPLAVSAAATCSVDNSVRLAASVSSVPHDHAVEHPSSTVSTVNDNKPDFAAASNPGVITLTVRSSRSAEFRSQLAIRSRRWLTSIRKMLESPRAEQAGHNPFWDTELWLENGANPVTLLIGANGVLVDPATSRTYQLPSAIGKQFEAAVDGLRRLHYGKLLEWKEAKKVVPRMAKFTIVDLETGLEFQGQRRAGSAHADVQPLTASDTDVMKQIYGGKWSWHRRAVLIRTDKGNIAASMHGMPHGGDGIPDNRFNGHFCIHFAGSTTHGSGSLDPAHQVMVHKAAGQLAEYMAGRTPLEVVELFVAAVNQQDPHLLSLVLEDNAPDSPMMQAWIDPAITAVRKLNADRDIPISMDGDQSTASADIHLAMFRTGSRPVSHWFRLRLRKLDASHPWTILSIERIR